MRIAVVGVGGVGGLFGGKLAQAGHDVTFIARGATLQALRTQGLRVESVEGDFWLPTVHATAEPAEVGPVSAVLLGVKAGQVAVVAPHLRPLLGPNTLVLPLQNGVEAPDQLAAVLGWEHVLGGYCRVIAQQIAPGQIRHSGVAPTVAFGALHAATRGPIAELRVAFEQAGVQVEMPADVRLAMWEKFLFVAPFGGVGAAARLPMQHLLAVPETRDLLRTCLQEMVAVAQASGVGLTSAAADRVWQLYEQTPAGGTASMQRDLMHGRPSELDAQTGTIVRLGRTYAVPTPAHNVLYAVLRPQELAARQDAA